MSPGSVNRIDRINMRELGVSVLFAAAVLFVAAMVMLSRNVSQLNESYGWVEKSDAILKSLYRVELKITGVEMTVRGYALSSNPMFVRMHRENHDKLMAATKALGDLIASEPALKADYVRLRDLVAKHDALYTSLIALGPGHREAVTDAITSPAKRYPRAAAVATLGEMRVLEQAILAQRQRNAEEKARSTYRLALGISLFAFLAGTLGFTLTLFGRRRPGEGAAPDPILFRGEVL
jgi:CHASE3 domain sensor protein